MGVLKTREDMQKNERLSENKTFPPAFEKQEGKNFLRTQNEIKQ
jgi:hypothetical protein